MKKITTTLILTLLMVNSIVIVSTADAWRWHTRRAQHSSNGKKGNPLKMNTIEVDGQLREYYVFKPASAGINAPLVMILHGGMGNAQRMMKASGMDQIARQAGFIVVYPEGTPGKRRFMRDKRTWNAGKCCGIAVKKRVDDVKFLSMVIDDMHDKYSIDRSRVYAMGISNGGMMAYRLACEIPKRIAAIVVISGTMAIDTCKGINDVAVMHIHGDKDQNVPINGGEGKHSIAGVRHKAIKETIQMVTAERSCKIKQHTEYDGVVKITDYNCKKGLPVKLVIIKGGTHTWPGTRTEKNMKNPVDMTYPASKAAWGFVKQFSKKY